MTLSPHPNLLPVQGEGKRIPQNVAWGIIAIACITFFYAVFGIEISVFALLLHGGHLNTPKKVF